jgi:FMN phosphatase YigB (HAD superfamily)
MRLFASTVVVDCVGVTLAGRRWRDRDPAFWSRLATGPDESVPVLGAKRIADAYTPNAHGWNLLRGAHPRTQLILANNGPWESFRFWEEKYGFHLIFDHVINVVNMGPSSRRCLPR